MSLKEEQGERDQGQPAAAAPAAAAAVEAAAATGQLVSGAASSSGTLAVRQAMCSYCGSLKPVEDMQHAPTLNKFKCRTCRKVDTVFPLIVYVIRIPARGLRDQL